MSTSDVLTRIERAYMALRGRSTPYGARSWFAREARVTAWTVTRWLSGRRSWERSRGPAILAQLETRAAINVPVSEAASQ